MPVLCCRNKKKYLRLYAWVYFLILLFWVALRIQFSKQYFYHISYKPFINIYIYSATKAFSIAIVIQNCIFLFPHSYKKFRFTCFQSNWVGLSYFLTRHICYNFNHTYIWTKGFCSLEFFQKVSNCHWNSWIVILFLMFVILMPWLPCFLRYQPR